MKTNIVTKLLTISIICVAIIMCGCAEERIVEKPVYVTVTPTPTYGDDSSIDKTMTIVNSGSCQNIKVGAYQRITCGSSCNIDCMHTCEIYCGPGCNIDCGDSCIVVCGSGCNIKHGERCDITHGTGCNVWLAYPD